MVICVAPLRSERSNWFSLSHSISLSLFVSEAVESNLKCRPYFVFVVVVFFPPDLIYATFLNKNRNEAKMKSQLDLLPFWHEQQRSIGRFGLFDQLTYPPLTWTPSVNLSLSLSSHSPYSTLALNIFWLFAFLCCLLKVFYLSSACMSVCAFVCVSVF